MSPSLPPGAWRSTQDAWGEFPSLLVGLPSSALVLADERVLRLHPTVTRALTPFTVVKVRAGEGAKTLRRLESVAAAAHSLRRDGALLCVGGGTLGDLGTVAAHLIKRGVDLIHVPTTLLAAVDSSMGGKGAIHVGKTKNALGAFHYPSARWLCPEFFTTLGPRHVRQGLTEAWKMALCLDASVWTAWAKAPPTMEQLIRASRRLKDAVCQQDPYDQTGVRRVLNFGHTFGHVLESLSHFRVAHGDAVGLGMLCALDVGCVLGVTSESVASSSEDTLRTRAHVLGRERLAQVLSLHSDEEVAHLLAADKKGADAERVKMVLLRKPGRTVAADVTRTVWSRVARAWRAGRRP
jgi:3-dehydroquinate synthase